MSQEKKDGFVYFRQRVLSFRVKSKHSTLRKVKGGREVEA